MADSENPRVFCKRRKKSARSLRSLTKRYILKSELKSKSLKPICSVQDGSLNKFRVNQKDIGFN
ncbi:hypothetical protein MNBD_GAMMA22-2573 [hydrothermal vent metagenome]|uniref:Uncharacterized protein n=1 Tax=hydrothermal vent metagenome TaxID=652676 RepID=A0A3B1B6T8_9ZZZZ